jgi:hypothetical protein
MSGMLGRIYDKGKEKLLQVKDKSVALKESGQLLLSSSEDRTIIEELLLENKTQKETIQTIIEEKEELEDRV